MERVKPNAGLDATEKTKNLLDGLKSSKSLGKCGVSCGSVQALSQDLPAHHAAFPKNLGHRNVLNVDAAPMACVRVCLGQGH